MKQSNNNSQKEKFSEANTILSNELTQGKIRKMTAKEYGQYLSKKLVDNLNNSANHGNTI